MMSGGISEALLTTQFGLAVAIPIMIIHHVLERRVDKIVGDMEEKGTAFAVTMIKGGVVMEEEAEGAA
jgi:biopolymer transport protein ExbB